MNALAQVNTNNANTMGNWLGDGQTAKIKIGHSFTTTNERALDAHEHLFIADEKKRHIYQVLEGVVGVYKMLSDGRRQIVTFYYPGDLIGIEETDKWMHHGEALCTSKVRCIPMSTIDKLINSEPGFGQALLSSLAIELTETRDQLLSLGRKSAVEKVATFLLRISKRNEGQGTDDLLLHLPMTRSEIADYLGLTIETVSRSITKLKKADVIHLQSKIRVQVIDKSALTEIANGNS